ncbi:amidase [Roseibium sp.]|uniref:amidase n=1 Tax=Roseibium sp. TaxID=1936156 RepID=UPI00391ADE9A
MGTMVAISIVVGNWANAANFSEQDLAYMPATTQIELFKRGVITPVDVLKAQIALYEAHEETINVVTVEYFDDAMKAAEEATRRYADGTFRELEGITVGVKDEHCVVDWRVTQGSLVHENDPPCTENHPMIEKLRDAGAIFTVQTTVPELYLNVNASNKLWGDTRNPWNPAFSSGGSSSGSGGALAAGFSTLATGSDMGGSIRVPSSLNGLYGYKPVAGEYHNNETTSYHSNSGPMARTFTDMLMMHNVMNGKGKHSPNAFVNKRLPLTYPSIAGKKIAYVGGMGIAEPVDQVKQRMDDAIAVFEAAGATVDRIDLDLGLDQDEVSPSFRNTVLSGAMGAGFATYEPHLDKMMPYAQSFIKQAVGGDFGKQNLAEAEELVKELYATIADAVFEQGYDVLILPVLATPHIAYNYDWTLGPDIVEDGRTYNKTLPGFYTIPFNFLNWMPVVAVPTGLTDKNMPVGMQIVAPSFETEKAMQFAYHYSLVAPKFFSGELFPTYEEIE